MHRTVLAIMVSTCLGILAGGMLGYLRERDQGLEYRSLVSLPMAPGATASIDDGPRIVVENGESYDFGVMERDQTLSHTFRIRNLTDRPLSLRLLDKTCKCTVERLPSAPIPPGEVGEILLDWTAKSDESEFRQSATLETSDPIKKYITLEVHGRVLQMVSVDPLSLAFSDVGAGEDRVQVLTLRSYESEPLRIESTTWLDGETAGFFDVVWETAPIGEPPPGLPAPTAALAAKVRLKPGMRMGPFEQRLLIRTNSQRLAKIEIPVVGNIVANLNISGAGYNSRTQRLDLGTIVASKGLTRTLRVLAKKGAQGAVEITDLTAEPTDYLRVVQQGKKELNQGAFVMYTFEVQVPPGLRPARFVGDKGHPRGVIRIKTNDPLAEEVRIETSFAIVADELARER